MVGRSKEPFLRQPGGRAVPVPLGGAQLPGPRITPPGRELVVIDTDGLETLCANPEEATAHMRSLIEDLAVRLARQYPDQDELSTSHSQGPRNCSGVFPSRHHERVGHARRARGWGRAIIRAESNA